MQECEGRNQRDKCRPSKVLDVGNCDPDHSAMRATLSQHFDVQVECVMFVEEALAALREKAFDLVLVNRKIFADGSPGLELVQQITADAKLRTTPVMMVSNFPEAQDAAVAAGAVRGFGKAALNREETLQRLAEFLRRRADA